MPESDTFFTKHAIHQTLERAKAAVLKPELKHHSSEKQHLIDRIVAFPQYLEVVLKATLPSLIKASQLDTLNKQLSIMQRQFVAYSDGKNDQSLSQANTAIDQAFQTISGFPRVQPEFVGQSFSETAVEFQTPTKHLFDELAETASALDRRISELQEATDAVVPSITENNENFKRIKADASQLVEQYRKECEDHLVLTKQRLDGLIKKNTAQFDKIAEDQGEEFKDRLLDVENKTKDTLKFLDTKRDQISKLVGVIADTSTTGHFQKWANRYSMVAAFFIFGAIASILSIVAILSHIEPVDITTATGASILVKKLTITIVMGTLARYLAKQGGFYRTEAKRYRDMENELASVGPLLEGLPEELQQSQRVILVSKLLGNVQPLQDDGEPFSELSKISELPSKVTGS